MMEQGYEDKAFFTELHDSVVRRKQLAKDIKLKYKSRTDEENTAEMKKAWEGIEPKGDWQHPVVFPLPTA